MGKHRLDVRTYLMIGVLVIVVVGMIFYSEKEWEGYIQVLGKSAMDATPLGSTEQPSPPDERDADLDFSENDEIPVDDCAEKNCDEDDVIIEGVYCPYGNNITNFATCEYLLTLQGTYPPFDELTHLGIGSNGMSFHGSAFAAGHDITMEDFLSKTAEDIAENLHNYLQNDDRDLSPDLDSLIIMDMEPEIAHPNKWYEFEDDLELQSQVFDAFKLRIQVARQELPNARLALYGVFVGAAKGTETDSGLELMENRLRGYAAAGEQGVYDEVDYILPVAFIPYAPGDPNYWRGENFTTALMDYSSKLNDSFGNPLKLAPVLGARYRNEDPNGDLVLLTPEDVYFHVSLMQEYENLEVITLWTHSEVHPLLPDYYESVKMVPCLCFECSDTEDNDNDGWTDLEDYSCTVSSSEDLSGPTACSNQIDDDGDGNIDGFDIGCDNHFDNSEADQDNAEGGSSSGGSSSSSSGGSIGINLPALEEECVVDLFCGAWSECMDGSMNRICDDLNSCQADITEYSECENEGTVLVIEEVIPVEQGMFNVFSQIDDGSLNLNYEVTNIQDEELKGLELELNINLGKSTKILDYLDTFDVIDSINLNRNYDISPLPNQDYEIRVKLYQRGKLIETYYEPLNLGNYENTDGNLITGEVIGEVIESGNTRGLIGLIILLYIIVFTILKIPKE